MTTHSIEIPDGIAGHEPTAFRPPKFGEIYVNAHGNIDVAGMNWSAEPRLILRKVPDPFKEVKEQLRHVFPVGTKFRKLTFHWYRVWAGGSECCEGYNVVWPDVPEGTEFVL